MPLSPDILGYQRPDNVYQHQDQNWIKCVIGWIIAKADIIADNSGVIL